MKILIAEDDREIRLLLAEILEDHGHACVQATDGQAAKEILEQGNRFDLLITDFRMPRLDGTQLLEWCVGANIGFPVIFLSANAELIGKEREILNACRATYLKKPIGIDQLLHEVEAAGKRR